MGTSSLTKFYYSDDCYLCTMYRNNDSLPEIHLSFLSDILRKIDIEEKNWLKKERYNWNLIVTKIINKLSNFSDNINLVSDLEISGKNDDTTYGFKIKPVKELYSNLNLILSKTLHLKLYFIRELEYEGILYDYLKKKNLNFIEKKNQEYY